MLKKFLQSKAGKITGDFGLSILTSIVHTFARQIVVFPLLASHLSDADYGILLTVAGLANVCTAIIGNALNNIRLIQNSKYEERGLCGDFNFLCAVGVGVSVAYTAVLWQMFSLAPLTAVLLGLYIIVSNLFNYATVFYRLELNFKRNFVCYMIVSAAHIAAAYLFATAALWPVVFLIGEGAGLVYLVRTTPFLREPWGRTPMLTDTGRMFFTFIAMNLIGNLLMYADRMLIYPVLGSESVSYYSTASFFGKSAGIVMTPIAGVLLGYFAQKDFKASKKLFALVNGLSLCCLAVFMAGCALFAPWFTKLLYPTLFEQSAPYILLANLAATISIAGNMAQPMVLKACSTKWTLLTQILYGGAYLLFTSLWMPTLGLYGFCYAAITANLVRLLALYAIGFWKF